MGEEHQPERNAKQQRGVVDEHGVLHRNTPGKRQSFAASARQGKSATLPVLLESNVSCGQYAVQLLQETPGSSQVADDRVRHHPRLFAKHGARAYRGLRRSPCRRSGTAQGWGIPCTR
jgi:hypothetical protein